MRAQEKRAFRQSSLFQYFTLQIQRCFRGYYSRKYLTDHSARRAYFKSIADKNQEVLDMMAEYALVQISVSICVQIAYAYILLPWHGFIKLMSTPWKMWSQYYTFLMGYYFKAVILVISGSLTWFLLLVLLIESNYHVPIFWCSVMSSTIKKRGTSHSMDMQSICITY